MQTSNLPAQHHNHYPSSKELKEFDEAFLTSWQQVEHAVDQLLTSNGDGQPLGEWYRTLKNIKRDGELYRPEIEHLWLSHVQFRLKHVNPNHPMAANPKVRLFGRSRLLVTLF
jgi:hypothetical protein